MKQFCSIGLLALSALLASHEPASAWVKFRFSAGINSELSFGGHGGVICGFWRQGHPPADCAPSCAPDQQHASQGGHNSFHVYAAPSAYPYGQYGHAQAAAPPQLQAPPPQPAAAPVPGYSNLYGRFYHHQPTSYTPTSYTPDQHYRFGLNFGR